MASVTPTKPNELQRYRGIRVLEVLRTQQITPQMRRVTLGGDEIAGFGAGPNVKLLIPPPGLAVPEWPMQDQDGRAIWPPAPRRPTTRTYSLRAHRPDAGEIDIDFVLHGDHGHDGVAAKWAAEAKPGDVIGIGGPGGRTVNTADRYLLVGDHTALPAIASILEKLPATARGHAFIEVPDAAERQDIACPLGIDLTWLYRNGAAPGTTRLLEDAVRAWPWPQEPPNDERIFAWIGCESGAVRSIRSYLRDERGLDRRSFLAIGYWRRGMSETAYKDAFNNDRDDDYYKAMREEQAERARP